MSYINVKDQQGVKIIRLNRPAKRNALNLEMYKQLTEHLIQGEADDNIRAFMISGNDECFTSGNDIADFIKNAALSADHPAVRFLFCVSELKKPLVAAVTGAAVGIGTTLLLHCDLVYADNNALFKLPFIDLGLVPEAGASLLLPDLVGNQKAAELLFLGESFDAQTAMQLKLISQVITTGSVFDYALEKATLLASKPPQALQLTRQLMRQNRSKVQHHMHLEIELFSQLLQSEEAQNIFKQFLTAK